VVLYFLAARSIVISAPAGLIAYLVGLALLRAVTPDELRQFAAGLRRPAA